MKRRPPDLGFFTQSPSSLRFCVFVHLLIHSPVLVGWGSHALLQLPVFGLGLAQALRVPFAALAFLTLRVTFLDPVVVS